MGNIGRKEGMVGKTDRRTDAGVSQDLNLSAVIVPAVEELLSLRSPAGHQSRRLIPKCCTHGAHASARRSCQCDYCTAATRSSDPQKTAACLR